MDDLPHTEAYIIYLSSNRFRGYTVSNSFPCCPSNSYQKGKRKRKEQCGISLERKYGLWKSTKAMVKIGRQWNRKQVTMHTLFLLLKKIGTEKLTSYRNQNYMGRKTILLNDYRMISPFLSAASTTVMFVEANAGLSLDFWMSSHKNS